MSHNRRTAQERSRPPATEAAALAALSVSESLMLAMVESGCLDPQIVRRCLLDAAAAYEKALPHAGREAATRKAVHAETVKLIDTLLRQVEAVVPSRRRG